MMKSEWKLNTMANGHLSCDNFNLQPDAIDHINNILKPDFETLMKKEKVIIGYDNWSGVFIMQMPGFQTDTSDDLIKNIHSFLSKNDLWKTFLEGVSEFTDDYFEIVEKRECSN